jgi:hypothetical protein
MIEVVSASKRNEYQKFLGEGLKAQPAYKTDNLAANGVPIV